MGQEFRVGIGASALQDSYLAALQACDQALQDCPEPQVAIVFGSIFNNQEAVLRGLNQKLPAEIILGGSSFAEISTAGVSESSVCVMLLSIPGGSFVRSKAGLQDNSLDVGRKLAQGLKYNMSRPVGLMFGSNGVHHGCEGLYLQGLEEGLGCIPVIGGATSGNFLLSMNDPEILVNYQYGGGSLERQSVDVGLLDLGPEMEVGFGWSHGWSPVAPPMTITRADGNKVYEVNGIPILDFYRQYIGADESRFFDYFLRRYGFCLLLGDNESQLTAAKIPSTLERGKILSTESKSRRPSFSLQRHGVTHGCFQCICRSKYPEIGNNPERLKVFDRLMRGAVFA